MTRIETLKLMGFSEEEAIEKATAEAAARVAFARTKVTATETTITVRPEKRYVGDYSTPLTAEEIASRRESVKDVPVIHGPTIF